MCTGPAISIVPYLNQTAHTRDHLAFTSLSTAGQNKPLMKCFLGQKTKWNCVWTAMFKDVPRKFTVRMRPPPKKKKIGPKNDTNAIVRGICFFDRNTIIKAWMRFTLETDYSVLQYSTTITFQIISNPFYFPVWRLNNTTLRASLNEQLS